MSAPAVAPSATVRSCIRELILGDQLVGDVSDGDDDGDGHAAFPGGPVAGGDRGVGGGVEVGVGHDDHVVLRPAERLDTLPVGRGGGVDVPGDRGGTDEADGLDAGFVEDPVDGLPVTVDDVEHPVGQAGLAEGFGKPQGGRGDLFAGLEDDGVAGGDGGGDHPQRDHGGEVERGDAGDHADGLAQLGDVDAGGGLFEGFALHVVDQAGAEFDVLEAAGDLPVGVVEDLAVFGGDDRGEFAAAGGDDLAEVEHDVRALGHAGGPPGGGGGLGGVDGGGEGGGVGEGDLAGLDAGGGVVHRAGAVTCGGGVPTDQVVEGCQGTCGHLRFSALSWWDGDSDVVVSWFDRWGQTSAGSQPCR
jgi:hypothetical protein